MFQLTAARRRLGNLKCTALHGEKFQLTAARRRLDKKGGALCLNLKFQLTAARRRLADYNANGFRTWSFNSQPPEGGWWASITKSWWFSLFLLSAARRRLDDLNSLPARKFDVSTHSRPKAAGWVSLMNLYLMI